MFAVVVVFNVLLSLLCLYVAWRVWNLRRALAAAANVLTSVERSTYAVLHGAPQNIYVGQSGVQGLGERYQQLELQLQRVQQVLTLLGLVQGVLRSVLRTRRSSAKVRLSELERRSTVPNDLASEEEAALQKLTQLRSKRLRRPPSRRRRR